MKGLWWKQWFKNGPTTSKEFSMKTSWRVAGCHRTGRASCTLKANPSSLCTRSSFTTMDESELRVSLQWEKVIPFAVSHPRSSAFPWKLGQSYIEASPPWAGPSLLLFLWKTLHNFHLEMVCFLDWMVTLHCRFPAATCPVHPSQGGSLKWVPPE